MECMNCHIPLKLIEVKGKGNRTYECPKCGYRLIFEESKEWVCIIMIAGVYMKLKKVIVDYLMKDVLKQKESFSVMTIYLMDLKSDKKWK